MLYSVTTISGPPLAVALNNQGFSKQEFRAALGIVRVAESSFTAIAYGIAGLFVSDSLALVPQILPAVLVGVPIGTVLIRHVRPETFRRVCMSFDAWVVVVRHLHTPAQRARHRQRRRVSRHAGRRLHRRLALVSLFLGHSTARHDLCRLTICTLEAEGIHILREVVAECERPVMLYSIGKDSSVLLRLAQKAFYPGPIPFPLLHIDTTYKFREMIEFRDRCAAEVGARLIVHTNREAIADGTQPFLVGTQRCCSLLKTRALLDALKDGGFDAAFGGARRDEERSRAKERIFSLRDARGQWDPKHQRPELWHLLNGRVRPGESLRVFPLSNWTEIDVWRYIEVEHIPVVPLYFAKAAR